MSKEKPPAKAKLVFTSRLAPKKEAKEAADLGIPISSELQARLPVVIAAGRTKPTSN
jgi:hypothetical protein